jgi:hypothetical protein
MRRVDQGVRLNESPASNHSQKSGQNWVSKRLYGHGLRDGWRVNLEFAGLNAEQDLYRQIDRLTAADPIEAALQVEVDSPKLAPPPAFLGLPYSGGDLPGQKRVEARPCGKQCGRKLMQLTQQTGVSSHRTVAAPPHGSRPARWGQGFQDEPAATGRGGGIQLSAP